MSNGWAAAFARVIHAACLCCVLAFSGAVVAQVPAPDDPFRYLEDASDPRTRRFFLEQDAQARSVLSKIPGRDAMLARVRELSGASTVVTTIAMAGARVFYLKREPGRALAMLCMRDGMAGAERVLHDPSTQPGGAAPIEWIAPSPDGRHVALGIASPDGEATLRVLAVGAQELLPFEIPRARFNRELAWHPDGRAFYYARAPEGGQGARRHANMRIYRHVLGRETSRDEIVFAAGVGGARGVPETALPWLHLPVDSPYAYAIVREGLRREVAVHVAGQKELAAGRPRWHRIIGFEDEVLAVEGWRNDLYVLSRRESARHRVLRVKANAADLRGAKVVVPEGESVIEAMALARDAIYLRTMVGGVDRLERAPLGLLGPRAAEYVRTPFDYAISQLIAHPRVEGAVLRLQGWIEPPRIVQVDRRGDVRATGLQPPSAADFGAMDEVRLYATSGDGTRIPVTLVYRKATRLTGDNPTLLWVYGSRGVTFSPRFEAARLAWLERGGVWAVAHVRGGGEYGETWHRAGSGAAKPNSVADLLAVAEYLVSYGFTKPSRLALQAAGAGAIAAGSAVARRPELFAALLARSPLADMLRYETGAEGALEAREFGPAATDEGLRMRLAISPYHLLREGVGYPAALFTVEADARTGDPWQAGKMVARLQATSTSGKPVLLRVEPSMAGGDRSDEDLADSYTFLLWQMGEPAFQLPPPTAPPPAAAPPTITPPAVAAPVPTPLPTQPAAASAQAPAGDR